MIAKLINLLVITILVVLGASLQGCSGGGAQTVSPPGTTSSSTATDVVVTLSLKNTLGAVTSVLDADASESIWVVAAVKDASGAVIPNANISFSLSNSTVASLPVSVATVTNGVAQVTMRANSGNTGTAYVMASVLLPNGARAISERLGFTVFSTAEGNGKVILGAVTMASPVPAYGSTTVSVPVSVVDTVSIDGVPNASSVTAPIPVVFTSSCISAGKATISPALTGVNGIATAIYQDYGCGKPISVSDNITASISGGGMWAAAPTKTVSVGAPASNNLQFVSASPAALVARGIGSDSLPQSAVVKFKVLDAGGFAKPNQTVVLAISPAWATSVGLSSTWVNSDNNGEVSVTLTAGTDPAKVSVVATMLSDWSVTAQSTPIAIAGLPTQDYFYLNINRHNIEADATAVINVIAYDRRGSPVPEGTTVKFVSEGGTLQGSSEGSAQCLTNKIGACSVTLKNTEYRPVGEKNLLGLGAVAAKDGNATISIDRYGQAAQPVYVQNNRVSLLAYVAGEKSFTDKNGNGKWDTDEVYFDMGNPLLDKNEDGKMTTDLFGASQEPQINSVSSGSEVCAAHDKSSPVELIFDQAVLNPTYVDALNAENTCNNSMDGEKSKAWVRRNAVIVFSGSAPRVSKDYYLGPLCSESIPFWLMDENGNPLPQGTMVSVSEVNLSFLKDISNPFSVTTATAQIADATTMVPDSTHAGGTLHQISFNAGTECNHTTVPFTGNVNGTLNLRVTLPSGAVTIIPYGINNH